MKLTLFYSDGTRYNLTGINISVHKVQDKIKVKIHKERKVSNIFIKSNDTITIDRTSLHGYKINKSKGNKRDVTCVALSENFHFKAA